MAKNELQQALDTIKKYCAQPKQKSFYEHMDNASLKQRIETLQSNFLHYVDHQTIWYAHTQFRKTDPTHFVDHPNRIDVELSKKQREDCIQSLGWLLNDIKACISHLEK
jgi:hypothetical protein